MSETPMHAGPRMQQLLAEAGPGKTPEEIAHDLAQDVLHGIYAAAAISTAMLDGEPSTGALLGLEAVLKQARRTASTLDEVLHDAVGAPRPLNLRLESEARP